ncbi:Glycosyltransferase AglI [uncultured archaeon]|nr:Glycosyltransferase AglI [uncultured archaeon]
MKFSLIIPVAPYRNAEILESINKLDFPKKEYEIIVENGTNASENRNRGFEKSRGKILVFLDDDGIINNDLLNNAEKFFKEHPEIDIVGGPQLTPLDEKGFAKISGYALSSKFGGWNTSNRYEKKKLNLNADETYLTTAIMFCRREVMDKIKFDTNLWPGEDPKFIRESKNAGFKVAYSPDLIIYHRRRPTIKALIKQIFNYGRVGPLGEKFSETLKKPFFLIPSLFAMYLLFILELTLFGINNIILSFPLILYGILGLLFSIYESMKNQDINGIFLLPFIFLTIHLSYGIGRIWGHLEKTLKKRR